ncbi:MAG: hypothetical protein ACOZNI_34460 [Myxococcota bacterium]
MARPRAAPPRPELVRRPTGPFGWLDARLVRDGWLGRAGPEATAALAFLALVADRQGSSFYGRDRMALVLGLSREALDRALARLLALGLIAHRPWRTGTPDGVWQVLPVAPAREEPRGGEAQSVAAILARLGLGP